MTKRNFKNLKLNGHTSFEFEDGCRCDRNT